MRGAIAISPIRWSSCSARLLEHLDASQPAARLMSAIEESLPPAGAWTVLAAIAFSVTRATETKGRYR